MVMDEARKSFHKDLAEVRQELVRISASIVESIPRGTHVLIEQDLGEAERMIFADDDIDARTVDIESRCIQILALQAPVAGELRQVVSALKICGELERSADLVTNLCKVARRINGHPLDARLARLISGMSDQAHLLMKQVLKAYAEKDSALAASVSEMDVHLDTLHKQFIQSIFEAHTDGTIDLAVAIEMAKTARFYERVGDHAVNIARLVQFMVTGTLPPAGDHHRDGRGDLTPIGDERPRATP